MTEKDVPGIGYLNSDGPYDVGKYEILWLWLYLDEYKNLLYVLEVLLWLLDTNINNFNRDHYYTSFNVYLPFHFSLTH